MCAARSNSHHGEVSTLPPGAGTPRGAETPLQQVPPGQIPLNFPLGCEPGDSSWPDPSQFPLGCGPEDPLARSPSTSPLGVGLETCKACWGNSPLRKPAERHAWITPAMHAGIASQPVDRQTHVKHNLRKLRLRTVKTQKLHGTEQ